MLLIQGIESIFSTTESEELESSVTYLQDLKGQLTQLQREFTKSNESKEGAVEVKQLKEQMSKMEAELRRTNEQMDNIFKQLVSIKELCLSNKS